MKNITVLGIIKATYFLAAQSISLAGIVTLLDIWLWKYKGQTMYIISGEKFAAIQPSLGILADQPVAYHTWWQYVILIVLAIGIYISTALAFDRVTRLR